MESLKKQYRDLEIKVMSQLRGKIEKSEVNSKYMDAKVIKVNVFDYTEMAIINDRLMFIDNNGQQHSVYSETSMEDLIDILNT